MFEVPSHTVKTAMGKSIEAKAQHVREHPETIEHTETENKLLETVDKLIFVGKLKISLEILFSSFNY